MPGQPKRSKAYPFFSPPDAGDRPSGPASRTWAAEPPMAIGEYTISRISAVCKLIRVRLAKRTQWRAMPIEGAKAAPRLLCLVNRGLVVPLPPAADEACGQSGRP